MQTSLPDRSLFARPHLRRACGWLAAALLAGCASDPAHPPPPPTPAPRGEVTGVPATSGELVQSDTNRLVTLEMRANLDSLYLLMDKLYRRNPAEWRKSGASSVEAAAARVRDAVEQRTPWPALQGRRDIAALSLALAPDFVGDRVAAVVYATADMLVTAHGGKTVFYLIDSLDAQHLYNAARNVEILVWMLAHRTDAAGRPLLLADELTPAVRNLSYEREFGKIVARLDLVAVFGTERYRRAAIGYVQGLLGGQFVQFLPVR
ncbi:hypothetical protein [Xylophilus sp. Leaf220]|uniref:hypothetical protein n=1 Tax=Xylophilus sp. Leaf220 TaxID=1735686 RepID=UPI0006FECFD4|nr:hypothetical protein ASE76_17145 [Xylophilus sp. Leaf220]